MHEIWSVDSQENYLKNLRGLLLRGGERKGEREGKEVVRKKERGGTRKGKGRESVPLALILQFDHWRKHGVCMFIFLACHAPRPARCSFEGCILQTCIVLFFISRF